MARLSREKLKGIVKECLVEILAEGLAGGSDLVNESNKRGKPRKKTQKKSIINSRPALDHITFGKKQEKHEERVTQTVNTLTADPVMASIFADTAMGTLQEQIDAERGGAQLGMADSASRAVASADPMDLFGESASNWADLAFAEKKIR